MYDLVLWGICIGFVAAVAAGIVAREKDDA